MFNKKPSNLVFNATLNIGFSFQNRPYGLVISRLNWFSGLYFQALQLLIRPLRLGRGMYCWKVAIAVYVNATILGYKLKKDATSFNNMYGLFRSCVG